MTALALVRQRMGRVRLQSVSPSKGLQLLHEMRPAQLFSYEGKTVAWSVRPFLMGEIKYCGVCAATIPSSSSSESTVFILFDKYNKAKKYCGLLNPDSRLLAADNLNIELPFFPLI